MRKVGKAITRRTGRPSAGEGCRGHAAGNVCHRSSGAGATVTPSEVVDLAAMEAAATRTAGASVAQPVDDLAEGHTLLTDDGLRLHARRWTAEPARAVVVLVHGLAASSGHPAVVRQAEALREQGFDVVSYDGRGHGRSEGQSTLGDLESLDVAAAVNWAKEGGLPVVLVGASMGGVATLRYAAAGGEELAGVVTISAPASWRTPRSAPGIFLAAVTRTHVGRRVAKHRMGVRITPTWTPPPAPTRLVSHLRTPLAVIHGDRDRYIATADAEALYRACVVSPSRLDLVAGMGHAFDELALPAVSAAVEWVLELGHLAPEVRLGATA